MNYNLLLNRRELRGAEDPQRESEARALRGMERSRSSAKDD
jgi:hypothetical protein